MKLFYACMCVLGFALPVAPLIDWLFDNGLNAELFFSELSRTRVGMFAWFDVIISAIVLSGFIIHDSIRFQIRRWWLSVVATVFVGVSLGLPLFLLCRELEIDRQIRNEHEG